MNNTFHEAIRGKTAISVIAEVKKRSPSYGKFENHSVEELVHAYREGFASAISVVTEPTLFAGSTKLLEQVRRLTDLPILQKDFISTFEQIDEGCSSGASAVLLIANRLETDALRRLVEYALKKGLDPVVEVYDKEDLEKTSGIEGIIIGINNRNLVNFETDVNHALDLVSGIRPDQTVIAESAFSHAGELQAYRGKIDGALIGTSLLTSRNPQNKLQSFTRTGQKPKAE